MSTKSETFSRNTVDSDEKPGGASCESMLITTDILEEFTQEMSISIREHTPLTSPDSRVSNISEIQGLEIPSTAESGSVCSNNSDNGSEKEMKKSESFSSDGAKSKELSIYSDCYEEEPPAADDYFQDTEWLNKNRHIFILSTAGKPIYSLHGNEDKLVTHFGIMQALMSFVQSTEDTIKSIHANGRKFVFLVRNPLILVAVCRTTYSVQQIQMQLTDVFNQIVSTLTLSTMLTIYEKRKSFDFRRLLAGSERLIDHLLAEETYTSNNPFMFLTHSVRILPMSHSVRDNITSAIQNNCSKIKNLVFAILIAKNKLITSVRMKKYCIHPADLRIIFNLVECSESFKSAESWTPICLPKFDSNGYLHAHISYLSDDCEACLLLMSVDKDMFFQLSDAKKKITEKLRRSNCFESINDAMKGKGINLRAIGIPEIRHFIYKCKSTAQLLCSEIVVPYNCPEQFDRLRSLYYGIHNRIHSNSRPLKLIYEMKEMEIILAWVTVGYELFVTFEPIIDKSTAITLVNKLLKWIKKEENTLFIMNAPHF